ncbi:hypothetical protein MAA_01651 [Metarhizium robertsii ARSEF 23]|uniref:Uncharacterized protein n=1 Tax=Metarhizium robertsii (strain ARSEF 23 / ATCC MYA-3075) TaxID=655844 RepID=E9EP59_METRA|nr:uncharacterized protein MAA_01651 [Metarhizium robertsii ARSEF 23]EFZ02069.2 hypothetical protein MAA_01651 [Metarhizium robertsii ARSEF 23]
MTEPNTTEAPSVDDCESPNSANSVATSQGDVPVDDSDGIPASEHYWQTVSDLAPDITRAAKTILSNKRPHFKKVVAVIAYWESASGLDHLRAQADKLGRLFKDDFKFEVLVYKIPDNVEDWEFISIIGGELCKVSKDRDGLFILYYGGSDKQSEYNLAQFPHYQDFVGPCRRGESASALIKKVTSPVESENRPRTAPDVLHRLTTMTDAAVCVAITFKCTAEAFMVESQAIQKNWQKWFRFAPTEVDDVIVQACREPPPTGCKRYSSQYAFTCSNPP